MKVFDSYAEYYDLLYRDKDYLGEASYVNNIIGRFSEDGKSSLLELGCGTGRHAIELANLGWKVQGIDLSPNMVQQANERTTKLNPGLRSKVDFEVGDIRSVRLGKSFDAAISLFHVISYQASNVDLKKAFATAAHHVRPGGIFVFDFWYGPAVLTDLPVVRVRRLENEVLKITRLAEPEMRTELNQVTVNYHVFLKDKETEQYSEICESHLMRYLFLPELEYWLKDAGFSLVYSCEWNSNKPLSKDSWYGLVIAHRSK